MTMRCLSGAWGTARWDREPSTQAVVWERLSCDERACVHGEVNGGDVECWSACWSGEVVEVEVFGDVRLQECVS